MRLRDIVTNHNWLEFCCLITRHRHDIIITCNNNISTLINNWYLIWWAAWVLNICIAGPHLYITYLPLQFKISPTLSKPLFASILKLFVYYMMMNKGVLNSCMRQSGISNLSFFNLCPKCANKANKAKMKKIYICAYLGT